MSLCRALTRTRPRELEKWGSDTDRVRPRARFGSGQEVAADPTKARLLFLLSELRDLRWARNKSDRPTSRLRFIVLFSRRKRHAFGAADALVCGSRTQPYLSGDDN